MSVRHLRRLSLGALLFVVLQAVGLSAAAQDAKISLKVTDVPLEDVLTQIEQKTPYRFLYSKESVNVRFNVSVNANDESVKSILDKILVHNGINYTLEKRQIVLSPTAKDLAEKVRVTGTVIDATGEPLAGVSVVSGPGNAVVTDIDGNYAIDVPKGSDLKFSYIGFVPDTRLISKAGKLNVTLAEDTNVLEEVVITGYGATSRKNLTTSISTVKTDKIQKAAISNVNGLLLGRAAGVAATVSSPQPGGGINVSIRGGGNPIYVVDGVVMPSGSNEPGKGSLILPNSVNRSGLQALNPADIESIEVLKDAAAAIYGVGAADGVILITTKKGKAGKPVITYDGSYSWQRRYKYRDLLSGPELMNMVNLWNKEQYLLNSGFYPYGPTAYDGKWQPIFSDSEIANAIDHDWYSDEFKTGHINNHNLTISGGSEWVKYYLGLNYYDEEATVHNSNMERFSMRTNIQTKLTDFMRLTTIANISQNTYRNSTNGGDSGNLGDQGAGAIYASMAYPSYYDVYDANGEYTQVGQVPNPVALRKIKDSTKTSNYYVNFALDIDIIKDWLSFRGSYGINHETAERDSYIPSDIYVALVRKSRGNVGYSKRQNTTLEGFLNFQHNFGNIVDLTAMLGMGRYLDSGNGFNAYYENANDILNSEAIEKAEGPFYPASYKYKNEKRSQFGRITGDFLNRYVVSFSMRRDGTDKFFPSKKYGWFPSVSLAWKLHEESFMRDLTWINMLKIRGSYGETGSDNLGSALYGVISPTRENVTFANNTVQYIPFLSAGKDHPEVTWQKTTMKNIGIDFSILNDRLSGSIDLFRNDITNMLGYANEELLGMYVTRPINGAHYRREGVEVSLNSTNIHTRDFTWTSMLTLSHYNAVWVKRMPNYDYQQYQKRKNEPVNYTYFYETDGIINLDCSNMPESQLSLGEAACLPGNPIVKDRNGDGSITIADIVQYNTTPKLYYGFGNTFTWREFDLDIFVYGQLGVRKWNNTIGFGTTKPTGVTSHNVNDYIYQAWNSQTNIGANAKYPGMATMKTVLPGNVGYDTGLERADYLRVRNITLGYTIPAKAMHIFNGYVSSIRAYVDFQNPFTITGYHGTDPEIISSAGNINEGQFPQQRAYTVGMKLTF